MTTNDKYWLERGKRDGYREGYDKGYREGKVDGFDEGVKDRRMVYLYECKKCEKEIQVDKPMSESDCVEHCHICGSVMDRVYSAPSINTADGTKR